MSKGVAAGIAAIGLSMAYAYYAAGKYDEALVMIIISLFFSVFLAFIYSLFVKRTEDSPPLDVDNISDQPVTVEEENMSLKSNQSSHAEQANEPETRALANHTFGINNIHLPYLLSGVAAGFVMALAVVSFSAPTTPEDCMLRNISNASSERAASVVVQACNSKFRS